MRIFLGLLIIAILAPLTLAQGNSNTVNERFPVSKKELEIHWQVDCAVSWASQVALRDKSGRQHCLLPAKLRKQLELCAFIYQAPGDDTPDNGPDYRAAFTSSVGEDCVRQADR